MCAQGESYSSPGRSFDIDPALLERRYKALQWRLHPDKMGHKPPEERQFSAHHASLVNLAYSILKSPLSRANYLVLEAREQVEETDDPAQLSALLARNRAQQEGLVAGLSAAFRADDLRQAVGLTHQLQYLAKLEAEIVHKMPQL
ncbi:hypothetical protein GPECTOR_2g1482 [Gonium pectorale]|uniref:J domain-containing protein n=1 Tax=Gonium pectorale TaxID=33097 RepID=A0A150H1G2_GONPE|nr:hypothetical protein GPECTOR_2g1482 [Gonium pectorale]|eukprot:KXZ55931.1 hypothetical protein GPECTOR_2g1482 [Gonium pectorale]